MAGFDEVEVLVLPGHILKQAVDMPFGVRS